MAKVVFETPWFSVHEMPSKREWHMGRDPFYCIVSPDAVLVIPVTDDGRFLMIRQYRPARGGFTLEFPAGAIDRGEAPLEAAQREMLEETGFVAQKWVPITVSGVANERESSMCHIFVAFDLRNENSPVELGIESILLLSPAELHDAILSKEMHMVATIGALFIAKAFLGRTLPDLW